jgi:hypothetical protein
MAPVTTTTVECVEQMCAVCHCVDVYTWNLTDAQDATLANLKVPGDLLTNLVAASPFTLFQNFRCSKIHFKFILTGSKFHQGRLLCTFSPDMASTSLINARSVNQEIQIGGVQLDPSTGGDVEYVVPFRHPKGHIDLVASDILGTLRIRVLNQLQAGTGASNSINVKVLFHLSDAEFKIPRASSASFNETVASFSKLGRWTDIPTVVEPQMNETPKFNSKGKAQRSINALVGEGTPVAPVRAKTGDPPTPHFGEKYDNLRDLGKRYRPVTAFTAAIAATESTILSYTMADLIKFFWQYQFFALIRGAINFKIRVRAWSATSTNAGTPAFRATATVDDSGPETLNNQYNTIFDWIPDFPICRIEQDSPAEFSVPFLNHSGTAYNNWNYNYQPTILTDYFDVRQLIVYIENLWTDSINFTIEIYAALGDEFTGGVFLGALPSVNKASILDGWVPPAEDSPPKKVEPQMMEGLMETAEKIIDRVIPDDLIVDAISGMLDKPQIAIPPFPFKTRTFDYLNHAVGPGYMDKMQLYPAGQQLTDPEHYGSPYDEQKILGLCKDRKSLVARVNWVTTDAVGAVLYTTKVGPMSHTPQGTAVYAPTLLDCISREFACWRGGIVLIFDVVTSAFHEGKLEVTYHPNRLTAPSTYNGKVSQYAVAFTVRNTENAFSVTFPYLGETPWKRVWNGNTLHENSNAVVGENVSDYFNGVMTLTVANPLRVPNSVAGNVNINIYVAAAEDFELNGVTARNKSIVPAGLTREWRPRISHLHKKN